MSRDFPNLSHLFAPTAIAIVGASEVEHSIGFNTVQNLIRYSEFTGRVYLVNPKYCEAAKPGYYPDCRSLPSVPDVIVVAVKAELVPRVLNDAGSVGVKIAVVMSAGFKEVGAVGKALEDEITAIVERTGIRIYGPNCPGFVNNNRHFGLTFSPAYRYDITPGPVGLVTQGGGLGRTFLQAAARGVKIGLWCSCGTEVDLTASDYVHQLLMDPEIRSVLLLLEGINDPEKLCQVAVESRRVGKPVIVMKVGRSPEGVKASRSHTAALAGNAAANSALFSRLGLMEATDIAGMVDLAGLARWRAPAQPLKVAVYSFSGGSVTLAADMLGEAGFSLATLEESTKLALRRVLPSFANVENPVDITGDALARPNIVTASLKVVVADPNVDAVIVPIPVEYGTVTEVLAEAIVDVTKNSPKPVVAVWMSDRLGTGYERLVSGDLVPIRSLSGAIKALEVWSGGAALNTLSQNNPLPLIATKSSLVAQYKSKARLKQISEGGAKAFLKDRGITVMPGVTVTDKAMLEEKLAKLTFPLIAKVNSAVIAHKTDCGGIVSNVGSTEEAILAWDLIELRVNEACGAGAFQGVLYEQRFDESGVELVVTVRVDEVVGPIVIVGLGGIYVEALKSVAVGVLPMTPELARTLIWQTPIGKLIDRPRGLDGLNAEPLIDLIVRLSQIMVNGDGKIKEIELNPVKLGANSAAVLDALMFVEEEA